MCLYQVSISSFFSLSVLLNPIYKKLIKNMACWKKSTDEPREESITEHPEEEPITEDTKRTLKRTLLLRNLKRTLSM